MAPRRAQPDPAPGEPRKSSAPGGAGESGEGRVGGIDYTAFDHLATLVAVVEPSGRCVFANSVLEAVVGEIGRAHV